MMICMQTSRCAYKEELSHAGWGGATNVPNNENYGTDAVCFVYTCR